MKFIRLAKKIEINKNSSICIPIYPSSEITCKIGDTIKLDTVIGNHIESDLLNEYDLSTLLKINKKDSKKYVNVINGEVVSKGVLLAKKSTFASLGYYEILSDKAGVVDLSRIENGKLSIYDHKKNNPIYPECNGIVTKIVPGEYIEIETSTISFNLSSSFMVNSIYGKFIFIAKANLAKEEYRNNMVFINSTLNEELYEVIKDKSPLLAIFPAIDAGFIMRNPKLNFPYLSFWGYSKNTLLTASYRNLLTKMNLRTANYNKVNGSLDFPLTKNSVQGATTSSSEYTKCNIGEKVITLNSENAFEEAEIIELFENECRVKYSDKKTKDLSFDEILALC